jgi:tRNA threonylcarbamoyl adenosine modification protein (Sua5/YciO/YrdC/YwlC family)
MAVILPVNALSPEPDRIAEAAERIRRGEVVAIPTDTVYGLAADPFNAAAVEEVFSLKGRSKSAPLLLLVNSVEMAAQLSRTLPPHFHRLAARFWPGPLTIVVDASPAIPLSVTAHTGRVGIRFPAAAIPCALIEQVRGPITATSANRSGEQECRSAAEVEAQLGQQLPLILDGGPSPAALPSTVLSLTESSWDVVREGAVSRAVLTEFFRETG